MQIEVLNKYISYFDFCIDAHTNTHTHPYKRTSIQMHIHKYAYTLLHAYIHFQMHTQTNTHACTQLLNTCKHMCEHKHVITNTQSQRSLTYTQALYHFIFLLLGALLKLHTYNSCGSKNDAREGNASCLSHCPLPVLLHCHAKNMSHSIILSFIVIDY